VELVRPNAAAHHNPDQYERETMSIANSLARPVQVIRLAFIGGVLMFGAAILFVHSQPGWKPGTLPAAVGYAASVLAVAAIVTAVVLRGRVMRESDPGRRISLLLAGWAVGEGAALLGGVIFFITGQSQWYLLGLFAMACGLAVLRIRGVA
jgi:hypothetical protein